MFLSFYQLSVCKRTVYVSRRHQNRSQQPSGRITLGMTIRAGPVSREQPLCLMIQVKLLNTGAGIMCKPLCDQSGMSRRVSLPTRDHSKQSRDYPHFLNHYLGRNLCYCYSILPGLVGITLTWLSLYLQLKRHSALQFLVYFHSA